MLYAFFDAAEETLRKTHKRATERLENEVTGKGNSTGILANQFYSHLRLVSLYAPTNTEKAYHHLQQAYEKAAVLDSRKAEGKVDFGKFAYWDGFTTLEEPKPKHISQMGG